MTYLHESRTCTSRRGRVVQTRGFSANLARRRVSQISQARVRRSQSSTLTKPARVAATPRRVRLLASAHVGAVPSATRKSWRSQRQSALAVGALLLERLRAEIPRHVASASVARAPAAALTPTFRSRRKDSPVERRAARHGRAPSARFAKQLAQRGQCLDSVVARGARVPLAERDDAPIEQQPSQARRRALAAALGRTNLAMAQHVHWPSCSPALGPSSQRE